MRTETIGSYEIEYCGIRLPNDEGWGAQVAIYGPSTNPMHRNSIFPEQRVSVEVTFDNEAAAEAEAHKVALSMIK
jgi:hypothetical protein